MVRRCLFVGLLIGVNVLAGLLALTQVVEPLFELSPALLVASLAAGQGSLLAVWAASMGGQTPWKLLGVVVVLVSGTHLLEAVRPLTASSWEVFGLPLLTQMLFTTLALLPVRLLGFHVAHAKAVDRAAPSPWFQFSILTILGWTAVVAVVPGMLQILPEEFRIAFFTWVCDEWAIACFAVAAVLAVAVAWIALNSRWWKASLALTGLVAAAAWAGRQGLEGRSLGLIGLYGQNTAGFLIRCLVLGLLLHTVCLFVMLCLLRLAGYRVLFREQGIRD